MSAERANMADGVIRLLGAFNGAITPILLRVAAVFIAAMTASVLLGVFFRYALNNSLPWVEDVSILMMIWVAFLVAPWAYRTGGHVSIEMIVNMFPNVMFRIFRIAVNLLVLWIIAIFFQEAVKYVQSGWVMRANSIPLPISWFRMIVPVSMALLFTVGIELILRDVMGFLSGSDRYDIPPVSPAVEPE